LPFGSVIGHLYYCYEPHGSSKYCEALWYMNSPRPPHPLTQQLLKRGLSVRLCSELVVGRRVLYYGVPFWRDAITVNVGHKMGPNLRLHFLRIVMLQPNASGSWTSRQRPKFLDMEVRKTDGFLIAII
jgi:hypothetical protein